MEFKGDRKELAKKLKCNGCDDVPGPKGFIKNRYMCINLKRLLCEKCNENCECGSPVWHISPDHVKKWFDNLPWYCPIACGRYKDVDDKVPLEVHQMQCEYRLVNCADFNCKWKIVAKGFLQHFNQEVEHKVGQDFYSYIATIDKWDAPCLGTFQLPKSITASTSYQLPIFPKVCIDTGYKFYLVGKVANENIYMWFFVNAKKSEAKHWEYSIMLDEESKVREKLKYSKYPFRFRGKVHAVDEDHSDIVGNNDCFAVRWEDAKKYFNYHNELRVLIRIAHDVGRNNPIVVNSN